MLPPPFRNLPQSPPPFLPGTLSPIVSHLSPRKSFIKSLRQIARNCLKWRGRGEVKDTGEQTQVNISINDWAMDVKVCMRDADVQRSSRRRGAWQEGSQGHAESLAGVTRETSSEGTQQPSCATSSLWRPAHRGSCACRAQRGTWPASGHTGPHGLSQPNWRSSKEKRADPGAPAAACPLAL